MATRRIEIDTYLYILRFYKISVWVGGGGVRGINIFKLQSLFYLGDFPRFFIQWEIFKFGTLFYLKMFVYWKASEADYKYC